MAENAIETAAGLPRKKARRFNRFDSPWLNPRLIAGVIMVGFVALLGFVGPLFWNTNLALVSSSPLNLPPAWIHNETPTPMPTPVATAAATSDDSSNGGFGGAGLG